MQLAVVISLQICAILIHNGLLEQAFAVAPTYGLICSSNAECKGKNEECSFNNQFNPACSKGRCKCLPCYTYINGTCLKKTYANSIGSSCTGNLEEIITVPNAKCFNGKVTCINGAALGTVCPATQTCDRKNKNGPQCQTDMTCGKDNTCQCSNVYMRFDADRQACVLREFGDSCSTDAECKVKGGRAPDGDHLGFTSTNGACVSGKCNCSSSAKAVQFSYIDPNTNGFKTKTICINKKVATTDIPVNATKYCEPDPIAWSDETAIAICDSSAICASCPENLQTPGFRPTRDGICRSVIASNLVSEKTCGRGFPVVVGRITTTQATKSATTAINSNSSSDKKKPSSGNRATASTINITSALLATLVLLFIPL